MHIWGEKYEDPNAKRRLREQEKSGSKKRATPDDPNAEKKKPRAKIYRPATYWQCERCGLQANRSRTKILFDALYTCASLDIVVNL